MKSNGNEDGKESQDMLDRYPFDAILFSKLFMCGIIGGHFNGICLLQKLFMGASRKIRQIVLLVFEGPVVWTEKRPKTGLNQTNQDRTGGCSCLLFKIKRLPKNRLQRTGCNQLQPVLGTPLKSAHFEPILKKIRPEMHVLRQKQYVTAKSNFV